MAKKWIRNTIIAVVVVAVATGGTVGLVLAAKAKGNSSTTTFTMATVTTGNIDVSVSGSGTVSSGAQYTLTSANAGDIDSLPIVEGAAVTKGETIAHIDDTTAAQNVTAKQEALTSAQAALSQSVASANDSIYIKTPIAGRVKSLIVSPGDDISTMRVLGSMCVISTDGKMKVSLNASGLNAGNTVKVVYNGVSTTGTVESGSSTSTSQSGTGYSSTASQSGSVSVLINRDDWPVNAQVTVIKSDGTTAGIGTLSVNSPIAISSSASGTIASVDVSENTMVTKDENLFKLNDAQAEDQISNQQQQVTNAQTDLASAKAAAAKATITSPVTGIISELDVKNGDTVSSGTSIGTIIDPTQMQTVVAVDELDITKVKVGQKVNISIDALPSQTFTGSVLQIDSIGTASNGVTTYNVTVSIDNATSVKVGMNATAEIIISSTDNVLIIPTNAVQDKLGTSGEVLTTNKLFDSNGKSVTLNNVDMTKLISENGKAVRLGMMGVDTVQVISGLSAGDKIAIPLTIVNSEIASTTAATTQNALGSLTGGYSGMGGYGGTRTRTGTGNTTATSKSTTATTGTGTGAGTGYGNGGGAG